MKKGTPNLRRRTNNLREIGQKPVILLQNLFNLPIATPRFYFKRQNQFVYFR